MPLNPPIVVEWKRLIVRPVEEGDLQALLLVNGDDEVTGFLPYASWRSLADASGDRRGQDCRENPRDAI